MDEMIHYIKDLEAEVENHKIQFQYHKKQNDDLYNENQGLFRELTSLREAIQQF